MRIACVGQRRKQVVHPLHLVASNETECLYTIMVPPYADLNFMVIVVPTPTTESIFNSSE